MKMRLSLTIALMSPADVLLLDDVLEVGDIGFQRKIANRLVELADGRTTVLVLVSRRCTDPKHRRSGSGLRRRPDSGRSEPRQPGDPPKQQSSDGSGVRGCFLLPCRKAFIELQGAEGTDRRGRGALKISFEVRALSDHFFRPLIDIRSRNVTCSRSILPGPIEMREGERHAFSVEVPWMLRVDTASIDLCFLAIEGERYHSIKSKAFVTVRLPNEWEEGAAIFDPGFRWIGGEVTA